MKSSLLLTALLAASSSQAANFGTPATLAPVKGTAVKAAASTEPTTPPPKTNTTPGPQVGPSFRIVKADGNTVIQQGNLSTSTTSIATLTVTDKDAFLTSNGKCAFNVKYDEVSTTPVTGTTNRLYSNDGLIAQNTKIDLSPNVVKTVWTQPYLAVGTNNIRVVVNADSPTPSTAWIRVNVTGTCGAATTPTPSPAPTPTPTPSKPEPTKPEPSKPTTPAPAVSFAPGSAEWNNLNNAWGYSNYATTQLKGKGYARYDALVKLNSSITTAINAKTVTQSDYNALITTWNTFVSDPAFKAAMAAIVPNTSGKK